MPADPLSPAGHAPPRGAYSPGVKIDLPGARLLLTSGQLARAADGSFVAPGDARKQTEFIFGLIGDILREGGMDFADIVRVQTYLTDMADFPKFREVRDRILGAVKPASTLIEVKGLAHPECCVEIEVTALRRMP